MKKTVFLSIILLLVISFSVICTISYNSTDGKSWQSRQRIIRKYYRNAQIFSSSCLGEKCNLMAEVFVVENKTGLALFKEGDSGRFELMEIETISEEGIVVMEVFVDNKYYYIGTIDRNVKSATIELKCNTPGLCCVKEDVLAYDIFKVEKPSKQHRFSVRF